MYIVWLFVSLAGLFLGSFLYTTAIRMAREESLWPFSHCDFCEKPVGWIGLMPVLGYLLQKGRCRHCHKSVSLYYPLAEIFNAGILALVFFKTGTDSEFLWMAVIWETLYLLALLDLKTLLIFPQPIVILFFTGVFRIYFLHPEHWLQYLLGLLCGAGMFHFISYFYEVIRNKKGLGEGDATLLGVLGLIFGWEALLAIVFYAALSGIFIGGGSLILKRKRLDEPLPFGPFMVAGAFIYWMDPWLIPLLNIY